jgi:hypothetical protein
LDKNNERPDWMIDLKLTDSAPFITFKNWIVS